MDHEDIMLSEIDQILKDKYCDSTYVRLVGKFTEAESRIVVVRVWENVGNNNVTVSTLHATEITLKNG